MADPLAPYEKLQDVFSANVKGEENQILVGQTSDAFLRSLSGAVEFTDPTPGPLALSERRPNPAEAAAPRPIRGRAVVPL